MPTIESPIGKVVSSGNSAPMRRYVVSDQFEDEFDPGVEMEDEEAKPIQKQQVQKQRVESSEAAAEAKNLFNKLKKQKEEVAVDRKNKLEVLIGLKKRFKSINIEGHKIELKALSGGEFKSVFEFLSSKQNDPNVVQVYNSRHAVLAYSIYSIDGEKIEDLVGEENDNFETRLAIVENLSDELISELHSFYEKEVHVQQPQTNEEVKEALKDIKK